MRMGGCGVTGAGAVPPGPEAGLEEADHVTVSAGGQEFAVPIERVQEVFPAGDLTRVPRAPPEVAGLLNLRGRVVTALHLRHLLGLPARPPEGPALALGFEHGGESYGLLVDAVGEVVRLPESDLAPNPTHLAGGLKHRSRGVHRRPEGLLVVLDVDALLSAEGHPPPQEARQP